MKRKEAGEKLADLITVIEKDLVWCPREQTWAETRSGACNEYYCTACEEYQDGGWPAGPHYWETRERLTEELKEIREGLDMAVNLEA